MQNELIIICSVLLGIGCILAIIVFASLIRIRYKDITVYLRIYLATLDFMFSFSALISILIVKKKMIIDYIVHGAFISHEFWLLYMCYSLYKTFYLKKTIKIKLIHSNFLIITVLGSVYSISYTYISFNYLSFFGFISVIIPTLVTFILLIFLYYFIKKGVDNDLKNIEYSDNSKIIATKRIYGYIIIFFILFIQLGLYIFEDESIYIFYICNISISVYPIANSIYYGLTKSTLKSLRYLFIENKSMKENDEIVNMLRVDGLIFPRFYYDTIGLSENKIININQ